MDISSIQLIGSLWPIKTRWESNHILLDYLTQFQADSIMTRVWNKIKGNDFDEQEQLVVDQQVDNSLKLLLITATSQTFMMDGAHFGNI